MPNYRNKNIFYNLDCQCVHGKCENTVVNLDGSCSIQLGCNSTSSMENSTVNWDGKFCDVEKLPCSDSEIKECLSNHSECFKIDDIVRYDTFNIKKK